MHVDDESLSLGPLLAVNNYGGIVPHSNKCQDCKDTNGFDMTLWSLLEKMQFLAKKYIITVFYATLKSKKIH